MQRNCLSFLTAAVVAAGCTGYEPSTTTGPLSSEPLVGARVSLRGTPVKNPTGQITPSAIVLLESDGTIVGLQGGEVASLVSVLNAEVEIQGIFDGAELDVESFVVLAVGGLPAADGVLELNGTSYSLRLTTGGRRDVIDPSPALKALVGDRVWVTGADDTPPEAFGVIEMAASMSTA